MAELFKFLAGPARVLIIDPVSNLLLGVGKSATNTTFSASITADDIRAGQGNVLRARYFHDSNLSVNIDYADFSLDYMALSLGSTVQSGGVTIMEEQLSAGVGGVVALSKAVAAIDGATFVMYKKPADNVWTTAAVTGQSFTPAGAAQNDVYCVKYFFNDINARQMTLRANYIPKTVHLIVVADEFIGKPENINATSNKYGKIIVDIPTFQFNGAQDLSLSSGAATTNLSGMAIAVDTSTDCDDDLVYGTITEQIIGGVWQSDVLAIAPEDGEIELSAGESTTLNMRVIFKGVTAATRKPNDAFTFTVKSGTSATVSNAGVVSAASGSGSTVIAINLTGYPEVPEAYAVVTKV